MVSGQIFHVLCLCCVSHSGSVLNRFASYRECLLSLPDLIPGVSDRNKFIMGSLGHIVI